MALKQENRRLNVTTSLGPDVLLLTKFSGREEMSRLFTYELDLISDDPNIAPRDIVGTEIGWSTQRGDGSRRHWHGYVSSLARGDVDREDRRNYHIEVVPWLWFLTQTSDCKIFQEKDISTITDEVLGDYGFSDYTLDLTKSHKEWEYCVQYNESDFNFLSRLWEQEGIFYYFKHSDGQHQLVLADHKNAYYALPESEVDLPEDEGTRAMADHLTDWNRRFQFVPGKFAQRDYNFKTPSQILESNSNTIVDLPGIKDLEVYEYPGQYPDNQVGKDETDLRMELEESAHEIVVGSSLCRTFQVGGTFSVGKHRDSAESGSEVVIDSIEHSDSESLAYETGGSGEADYANSFSCIPSDVVFRPQRITRKPLINGIQTAIVTGPAGEEIYPDEHGRVKCQFHWDRYGENDDKSSCWIRVSQAHAGPGFGAMYLPRIGEEVVVNFLEGDPNRPLITGRVYHAENTPHYQLPDHKTRMTMRTRSSQGGDGFNELTMEDLKGEELVYMRSEKDKHQIVGHGPDGGSQRELVHTDKHLNIKENQIEKIEGNYELCVGHGAADGGNHDVCISGQRTETIGGGNDRTVARDERVDIGNSLSETIGLNHQTSVGMNHAVEAGLEAHIKAGMNVVIEAGVTLTLKVGGNFINISPAGIAIQGTTVLINSGGAPGTGSGCSPDSPSDAAQADPEVPEQPE